MQEPPQKIGFQLRHGTGYSLQSQLQHGQEVVTSQGQQYQHPRQRTPRWNQNPGISVPHLAQCA